MPAVPAFLSPGQRVDRWSAVACSAWVALRCWTQIEARAAEAGIPVEKAKEDLVREKQPMLRYTSPEQIGALTVFLCGDDAATITGAALSIDGGWTAQ